jgi:hypothetical protein
MFIMRNMSKDREVSKHPSNVWRELPPETFPEVARHYYEGLAAKDRLTRTGVGYGASPGGEFVDGDVDLTEEVETVGPVVDTTREKAARVVGVLGGLE